MKATEDAEAIKKSRDSKHIKVFGSMRGSNGIARSSSPPSRFF